MKRQFMKIHNMDSNDKPKHSNNQRIRPVRILSVTIIATTLLGLGILSSPASAAKAEEAILPLSAGSMAPSITPLALDQPQSGSVQSSEAARVPDSVMNFAEDTVDQLSVHAPFTTWDEAELAFTPLGPGTHGWLVTIEENGLPQGYMIISASEDGGYVLSEYGIGPTLPFSQAPLNERLAAEGLLKGGTTLPAGSIVRKLYDVSPVWQVELPGKKPVYFSALNSEPLPDQPPLARTSATPVSISPLAQEAVVSSTGAGTWKSAAPSTSAGGEQDPYDNLLWLASSPLEAKNSTELLYLLEERSSLIFRSAAHNAAFGSPFQLNGWQSWSIGNNEKSCAVYVSVPMRNSDTLRYLPASWLLEQGVFYASVDK